MPRRQEDTKQHKLSEPFCLRAFVAKCLPLFRSSPKKMKIASISELKKEIAHLPEEEMKTLIVALAKFSKENKELLNYLLFEADFEPNYIQKIKDELDIQFSELNKTQIRYLKKGLQKIIRELKKNIKYSGKKQTEIELLIYFCQKIIEARIKLGRYPVLINLYNRQLKTIEKAVSGLEEDLQYDYNEEIETITEYTAGM